MVTTTAQAKDLLLPDLNVVFGEHPEFPPEWEQIFEKRTSDMYREVDAEVKMLGLAQLRSEGQSIAYEDMGERYKYVYLHKGVGSGFIMTKFMIRDNLYKKQFGPSAKALLSTMRQTKEVFGAAIFNNATDGTNYPGGDGVSLLSASHPIDVGVVANTPAIQTELSETALQDGITAIRRFRNAAGLRVMTKPKKLVIPPDLTWVTERLLHTTGRVGTTDNDINAIRSLNAIPGSTVINDFFTNTKGWFILTDAPNGLKFFQRDPVETDMYVDFDTDNLKVKATERYSFGWSDFRSVYGSLPT